MAAFSRLARTVLIALAWVTLALGAAPVVAAAGSEEVADTTGMALLEWTYDTWTVPWVQVRGGSGPLHPGSYATLMTITCESSMLEVERRARHLSAADCEHRMAAIRAEYDTSLIFRVRLIAPDRSGSRKLVRMGPHMRAVLEDDRGWHWSPGQMGSRKSLGMATGQEVKRLYMHRPEWMLVSSMAPGAQRERGGGSEAADVESWIRFPRRHPDSGDRILTTGTRWLRLRVTDGRNEWVATWPFLPEEEHTP